MTNQPMPRTPGATRAAPGEYLFDLGTVSKIMGGPDYSTAHGPCVEGDRMIVGLMRMKAGTGAEPIRTPTSNGSTFSKAPSAPPSTASRSTPSPARSSTFPANTIHAGKATPEADVVFFTVKDASHSLHGIKAS